MTTRLNPFIRPDSPINLLVDFGTKASQLGLETSLMELVKTRASQINGCAVCLDLHTRVARKHGETEQRLYMLDAWRETPLYTDRERAALAWTEALTRLTDGHASDENYEMLIAEFTPEEQAALTLLIVAINGFNRIGVGFRAGPMTEAQLASVPAAA
ncbi:MAG: carboxymuconolactone decarboxylase family protein [Sphingomonas sp.]|jgi:AhpD family alkylhydroperoxidase|uniref:carboxymuconolactone decarboxylase family protein n=1 Tax=Sphingomonas sp. TaxID=28214 RepID=UPI003569DE81